MTTVDDPPTREQVRALPKVELHRHLDGAARPATLLELAQQGGIALPADDVDGLAAHVQVSPDCRSLRQFLQTFQCFYPVLAVPGAMQRLAHEALEDAADDGIVHVELRFCPALHASERQTAGDVVTQVLAGLDAAGRATGVGWGAILCCYRALSVELNAQIVELALAHADRGVVGLDLAGPEDLPGRPFAPAFARAREAGLPLTVHAGEVGGPDSVREAVDLLAASRLGHAVALRTDPELSLRVRDTGIALECCPTSNLQTRAVASLDEHPFERLRREHHLVTLNTDDPSVCGVTLTDEYLTAARQWGYDLDDLRGLALAAADAAFVDEDTRARLRRRLEAGSPAGRGPPATGSPTAERGED